LEKRVSTKSSLIRKIKKSKEYRDEFVDAEISVGLPFQIRALREQHGWSQKELAEATAMLQPRICAMEQAGYGNFTLNTLKKLASAFDVGLLVRFVSFGELVNLADVFSPDTFRVPSSKEDPVVNARESRADPQHHQGDNSFAILRQNQIGQTEAQPAAALIGEATPKGNYSDVSLSWRKTAGEPQIGGAALAATQPARAYG
jgi:transcriptional regulator with XRE-family HTH domain